MRARREPIGVLAAGVLAADHPRGLRAGERELAEVSGRMGAEQAARERRVLDLGVEGDAAAVDCRSAPAG